MSEQLPLLYITSNGRSGSTLLDLLLGSHSELWTAGELQLLDWHRRVPSERCGCSAPFNECPFWGALQLDQKDVILQGRYHYGHGATGVIRPKDLKNLWLPSLGTDDPDYAEASYRIARTILRQARMEKPNTKWLVDASKTPYRLLALSRSSFFNVFAIHITKRPEAFVHSMTRNATASTRTTLRMAMRWIVENRIIDEVLRRELPANQRMAIKYEDLATDPEKTLRKVQEKIGIPPEPLSDRFRDASNHALFGNQMRWRRDGIKLDTKWLTEMNPTHRYIARSATRAFSDRFGY
ncbi:MAG: sulfotransferase [Myxococcota bacterium]